MLPDKHFRSIAEKAVSEYGALQDEWEFAVLLHIVAGEHPAKMLEIGSYTGGSLYAWREALPDCHVYGCTIGDVPFHSWGASMVIGDSTVLDTQQWMHRECSDADFVFVDGGHDEHTAASDMDMAFKLTARKRGLIGIHDINLFHRYPDLQGPRLVWNAWRARYPGIEIVNIATQDPGTGLLWNR
jgi:hypothetical protein